MLSCGSAGNNNGRYRYMNMTMNSSVNMSAASSSQNSGSARNVSRNSHHPTRASGFESPSEKHKKVTNTSGISTAAAHGGSKQRQVVMASPQSSASSSCGGSSCSCGSSGGSSSRSSTDSTHNVDFAASLLQVVQQARTPAVASEPLVPIPRPTTEAINNGSNVAGNPSIPDNSSSGANRKSARRHSEGFVGTPESNGAPGIVKDSDEYQGGSGAISNGSNSRRDTTDDGKTRPARRKVHRAESREASPPATAPEDISASTFSLHPEQQQDEAPEQASVDIASFSTPTLLHLLAELLTRITLANDAIRAAESQGMSTSALENVSGTGARTPPASAQRQQQKYQDPVTPAVPFSSPVASPHTQSQNQSSSSQSGHSRIPSGFPFPRDRSSSINEDPEHSVYQQHQRQSSMPRTNFAAFSPPHPSSPHATTSQQQSPSLSTSKRMPSQIKKKEYPPTLFTSASAALQTPNATLCFHARNVPSISIESYLVRISKYCPTTNEVFISLLVYFDRLSRLPNLTNTSSAFSSSASEMPEFPHHHHPQDPSSSSSSHPSQSFAVDSFNIHRLIISGITVASKFFSDIFYTNSRYAKVGGLPLQELNALELQFLLLNGFDLTVSNGDLQVYADYLVNKQELPPVDSVVFPQLGALHHSISTSSSNSSQSPIPSAPASHAGTSPYNNLSANASLPGQGAPLTSTAEALAAANTRPKNSFRSASESSTSASEASTVVPSEDSISTQRAGDESEHDDEEMMHAHEGIAGVGAVAADDIEVDAAPDEDDLGNRQTRDSFAKPRSRATTPSAPTAVSGMTKAKRNPHRRENSRTREWTHQQQQMQIPPTPPATTSTVSVGSGFPADAQLHDQDTEMSDA